MKRDAGTFKPIKSSFLNAEKDTETIIKKLFVESRPYSDELKRLLVINTKDCLDNITNEVYEKKIKEMNLGKLMDEGYIKITPKVKVPEHEEVKSYLFIDFDDYTLTATNPQFRDNIIAFEIICHTDYWDLGNYRLRPLKIAGYIDGILNNTKLSGIGTLIFRNCYKVVVDENLSGYRLIYDAVHGSDDRIPREE